MKTREEIFRNERLTGQELGSKYLPHDKHRPLLGLLRWKWSQYIRGQRDSIILNMNDFIYFFPRLMSLAIS